MVEEECEVVDDQFTVRCSAALCFRGGWVTDADAAVLCEGCYAPEDTFHAVCAGVDPAKMPADWDGKWLCPECEAEKKAKEDAAEKVALKKDGDQDYEEEKKSKKKPKKKPAAKPAANPAKKKAPPAPKKKRAPRKRKAGVLVDEDEDYHCKAPPSNNHYGTDKTGRPNPNVGRAWGKSANPAKYVECKEGTAHNPGPAVDGAEELVAEAVPEACLGYPDYKHNRGNKFFMKSGPKAAQLFYKANGYWKIAVKGSRSVFKFFKEVKRA